MAATTADATPDSSLDATGVEAEQGVVAGEITPAPAAPDEAKAGTQATYFDFETSSIESLAPDSSEPTSSVDAAEPPTPVRANGAAAPEESDDSTPAISLVSATEATSAEPGAGFWKPGEHPVSTTTTAESTATAKAAAPQIAADCTWCEETLPDRSDVNYCPHCGMSTNVVPCSSCRTEMEPSWKFCVACGTQA